MATILIVDDRAICREFLITLLKYDKHQLLEAGDGLVAYDMVIKEHPHLIITDLLMPTMNGYELVQQIKKDPQLNDIPIIFYTASFLLDEAKLLAESCDVKHVLFKPCEPELILKTIKEALASKPPVSTQPLEPLKPQHETSSMSALLSKIMPLPQKVDQLSSYLSQLEDTKKSLNMAIRDTQKLGATGEVLSQISDQFSKTFSDLCKVGNQLVAMSELSLNMISERESKHLLNLFCEGTRQLLDSKYCFLGILDYDNKKLKHLVVSGIELSPSHTLDVSLLDCGLIKQIFDANRVLLVNAVSEKLRSEFNKDHPPITDFLGMRLITANHLYGFVYFVDKNDGTPFTESDCQLVSSLAAQLSMLYENIDLYDTIQRHAAKLQISMNERQKQD